MAETEIGAETVGQSFEGTKVDGGEEHLEQRDRDDIRLGLKRDLDLMARPVFTTGKVDVLIGPGTRRRGRESIPGTGADPRGASVVVVGAEVVVDAAIVDGVVSTRVVVATGAALSSASPAHAVAIGEVSAKTAMRRACTPDRQGGFAINSESSGPG